MNKYVESGNFLWNAGIFAWQIPVLLEELDKRISDNMKLFRSSLSEGSYNSFNDISDEAMTKLYSQLISISIDLQYLKYQIELALLALTLVGKTLEVGML